jgi:hypothetical protein
MTRLTDEELAEIPPESIVARLAQEVRERRDKDALKAMYEARIAEITKDRDLALMQASVAKSMTLVDIVRDLANTNPVRRMPDDGWCAVCGINIHDMSFATEHSCDCPWQRAVDIVKQMGPQR